MNKNKLNKIINKNKRKYQKIILLKMKLNIDPHWYQMWNIMLTY